MVAHCRRQDTPDLLLDYDAQSQARSAPLLFDLGTPDSEEEEEEEGGGRPREVKGRQAYPSAPGLEHVIQVGGGGGNINFYMDIVMNSKR